MSYRNVCFTLNNYTEENVKSLLKLPTKYLVFGREIGDSGTPHLQGYLEFDKRYRFNTAKRMLPKCHLEPRKGTAQQAADYCKKDKEFTETGTISEPGKRTDLAAVYDMAKANKSDVTIGEAHPATYMKFYKAVDRVRLNYARLDNKFSPVDCYVIVGKAGEGKTRKAYDFDPDLYRLVRPKGSVWFDGYQGQKTLLIDDFYGGIAYGYLLQLLDGYKFQLPIKGGFTWKQWKTVIITSNAHPEKWYPKFGFSEALKRRVSITPPPLTHTCDTNI